MFATIGRSWQLFKLCLHVLSVDKELIFFPIFSTIGVVIVTLTFFGVTFGIGSFDRLEAGAFTAIDLVAVFAFYVVSYFIVIFFNSALVFAAHERLEGGDPNIRSGLAGASSRIVTIFFWAVIAATVGLILQILSSQARERGGIIGIIGQIVVAIIGAAWSLITFFVVPLIVIEHRGLFDSFKTSLSMLRRTWGEQVVGNFGLGLIQLGATLVAVLIAVVLGLVLSLLGTAGIVLAVVIGIVLVAGVSLVFATLSGIYKAALYNYAADGQVPALFTEDTIRGAFRPR
ncbi:MAG: DUF6159 family protein [Chloroflexi bacterium]|nr:DUF6159 family protein [Chloroflexota bacterium]